MAITNVLDRLRSRRTSLFSSAVFDTNDPLGPEETEEDSTSSVESWTRVSFTSIRRWTKATSPRKGGSSPLRKESEPVTTVPRVKISEHTPPPSIHLDLQPTLFLDAQLREAVGLDQEDFETATTALPESSPPGHVLKGPHQSYMPSRSTTDHWRTRPATESTLNPNRMAKTNSDLNIDEGNNSHLRLHLDTSAIDMSVGISQLPSPGKSIELPFRLKRGSKPSELSEEPMSPLQMQARLTSNSDEGEDGAYRLEVNDIVQKGTCYEDEISNIKQQSHRSPHAMEDLRPMHAHREQSSRSSLAFAASCDDHERILARITEMTCQVCGGKADHVCEVISPSKLSASPSPLKEKTAAGPGDQAIMQTPIHKRTGSQHAGTEFYSSESSDQADSSPLQRKRSDPVGLGLTTEWLQSLSPTGARCQRGSRRYRRNSGSWMSNRRSSQEVNEDMMAGRAETESDGYSIDGEESTDCWVKVFKRL